MRVGAFRDLDGICYESPLYGMSNLPKPLYCHRLTFGFVAMVGNVTGHYTWDSDSFCGYGLYSAACYPSVAAHTYRTATHLPAPHRPPYCPVCHAACGFCAAAAAAAAMPTFTTSLPMRLLPMAKQLLPYPVQLLQCHKLLVRVALFFAMGRRGFVRDTSSTWLVTVL